MSFIRGCTANGTPTGQLATLSAASCSTTSPHPRIASPWKADMTFLRAALCASSSSSSTECSPMIGPRIALPSPAWKVSAGPANTSRMCSGRVSTTARPAGAMWIEKTSP